MNESKYTKISLNIRVDSDLAKELKLGRKIYFIGGTDIYEQEICAIGKHLIVYENFNWPWVRENYKFSMLISYGEEWFFTLKEAKEKIKRDLLFVGYNHIKFKKHHDNNGDWWEGVDID